MCKEMPVIPVNRVVDTKRIIGKNGWPRRRGTGGCQPKKVIGKLKETGKIRNGELLD
jgi:hypothetical protein